MQRQKVIGINPRWEEFWLKCRQKFAVFLTRAEGRQLEVVTKNEQRQRNNYLFRIVTMTKFLISNSN